MNIEMEITLRCNAYCPSCSRHSPYGLYDEASDVTIEQVDRFCAEVKGHGHIEYIWVMGGEPTLHPELGEILYKLQGLNVTVVLVSNGILPMPVYQQGEKLQYGVDLRPPCKGQDHRCMLVAPYDTGQELKECPVPKDCGVSWGAYGWYPCGAGGAICRLFDIHHLRSASIPKSEHDFQHRMPMCIKCQAKAKTYMMCRDFGDIKSRSFCEAFQCFDPKRLRRY